MKYGSLNNSLKLSRPIISLDIETPSQLVKLRRSVLINGYMTHIEYIVRGRARKAHGTHLLLLIISSK
jgi:hypothetical protein